MHSINQILVRKAQSKDLKFGKLYTSLFSEGQRIEYSAEDFTIDVKSERTFLAENSETGEMLGHISASEIDAKNGFIGPCFLSQDKATSSNNFLQENLKLAAQESLGGKKIIRRVKRCSDDELAMSETNRRFLNYSGIPFLDSFKAPLRSGYGVHICHAQMVPEDDLVEFDQSIVGSNRRKWIRHFLNHSNVSSYPEIPSSVSLVVTLTSGPITGWGSIRPGKNIYKLGPLYAKGNYEKSARLLLKALIDSSPGARKKGLDALILNDHSKAKQLMEEIELKRVSKMDCVLSSADEMDFIDSNAVYALSNFETQYV